MVSFYWTVRNKNFKYAVIVSKYNGKWVFCKHKNRDTYECPGGHREVMESIDSAARRELWEETGALDYKIVPVCAYSVTAGAGETFGMLYYADIRRFGKMPVSEIERVIVSDELPKRWTYPDIQPHLVKKAEEIMLSVVI